MVPKMRTTITTISGTRRLSIVPRFPGLTGGVLVKLPPIRYVRFRRRQESPQRGGERNRPVAGLLCSSSGPGSLGFISPQRRGVLKSGSMGRGPVSRADAELIGSLRELGVEVSAAQLERWRTAEVLPRNKRRGLGRGAGSVSRVSAETLLIAAALSRAARRGRPLHETVLRAFTGDHDFRFFLATARPPLPEQAVRAALVWFVRHASYRLERRIERAIAAAASDDDAEDIAEELAERHYRSIYLSHRRDFDRDIMTEGRRLTRRQAHGSTVFTLASFFGKDAVGSNRLVEAFRDSWGYAGNYDAQFEELVALLATEGIKRELAGLPLHDLYGSSRRHTVDTDTQAICHVDFAAICKVRDVLALLAETITIYRITKDNIPDDPIIRRLVDFFASSLQTHVWVRAAARLAYKPPDYRWQWMASMIEMICCDPDDLGSFEEMTRRIDFTREDIDSLLNRALQHEKRS